MNSDILRRENIEESSETFNKEGVNQNNLDANKRKK
jgi:hypothetical protein